MDNICSSVFFSGKVFPGLHDVAGIINVHGKYVVIGSCSFYSCMRRNRFFDFFSPALGNEKILILVRMQRLKQLFYLLSNYVPYFTSVIQYDCNFNLPGIASYQALLSKAETRVELFSRCSVQVFEVLMVPLFLIRVKCLLGKCFQIQYEVA